MKRLLRTLCSRGTAIRGHRAEVRERFLQWLLLEPSPDDLAARQAWVEAGASVRRSYVAVPGTGTEDGSGAATPYIAADGVWIRP